MIMDVIKSYIVNHPEEIIVTDKELDDWKQSDVYKASEKILNRLWDSKEEDKAWECL